MQHIAHDILFLFIVFFVFIGILKGSIPSKKRATRKKCANAGVGERCSRKW